MNQRNYIKPYMCSILLIFTLLAGVTAQAVEDSRSKATMDNVGSADLAMINTALSGSVNVNSQDKNGATALVHAATAGDRAAINQLLSMGADPNIRKHNGGTALIAATQTGHDLITKDLLNAGANTEFTALGGKINALYQAVERKHTKTSKVLLEGGADPNPQISTSPLHHAVERGNLEEVNMLLEFGAEINHMQSLPSGPDRDKFP